ncbi:trypsin-like peptidase domain-containing protein [bacterium]|nr:trypsin-like peptidase domain-containing protein [bacterium]
MGLFKKFWHTKTPVRLLFGQVFSAMKKHPFISSFVAAVFGGLLVLTLGPFSFSPEKPHPDFVYPAFWSPPAAKPHGFATASVPNKGTSDEAAGFRLAANAALDAVVHIRTQQNITGSNRWPSLFGQNAAPRVQYGSGSGVILHDSGFIVTNHHVIQDADVIEIGLNDNRNYKARLLGSDPATDIAVLQIDASGLTALPWGNSDKVHVGDWVLAVGNPFDLTSTVTAGIVSAKARNLHLLKPDRVHEVFPVESFIQTDAAVNPGNSGGALVNTSGELIGINTAIASKTGSYSGYSFAVPANLAKKVALDLIEFGQVQRAYLGVTIRAVDERIAAQLGLPEVEGVLVSSTATGSGAQEAGLKSGDVILTVDGAPTSTLPLLLERVNQFRPGEFTDVQIWRDRELVSVQVELRDRDGKSTLANAADDRKGSLLGGQFKNFKNSKLSGAEVLPHPNGAFARANISSGTVITTADGKPIDGVDSLIKSIKSAQKANKRGVLLEGISPNGEKHFWALSLRP